MFHEAFIIGAGFALLSVLIAVTLPMMLASAHAAAAPNNLAEVTGGTAPTIYLTPIADLLLPEG